MHWPYMNPDLNKQIIHIQQSGKRGCFPKELLIYWFLEKILSLGFFVCLFFERLIFYRHSLKYLDYKTGCVGLIPNVLGCR